MLLVVIPRFLLRVPVRRLIAAAMVVVATAALSIAGRLVGVVGLPRVVVEVEERASLWIVVMAVVVVVLLLCR